MTTDGELPPADYSELLLQKIDDLIDRGADAYDVRLIVKDGIANWLAVATSESVRNWLEQMREQLADGVEATREQIEDLEGSEKASACQSLTTLVAVHDALVMPNIPP